MPTPLSGPGLGLPLPQNLYPTELFNAPYDASTNSLVLAPGVELSIPAGTWLVNTSQYLTLEFLNPITNTWSMGDNAAWAGGHQYVKSDGFNVRVANRLGCPISAVVAALGSAYVQATTTITPTPGNSTWLPIIGGQLELSGATLTSSGAGYGVAPLVIIPAPPPAQSNPNGVGGLPASGYCTIASGTISGFTFISKGAGYPTAPTAVIVPNPTDPNITSGITAGTITFTLSTAGVMAGAICTNPGAPLSNPNQITLTIAGAGSGASLTANVLQTVTIASVSGAGAGLGYGSVAALGTTVGGVPVSGSIAGSPFSVGLAWRPRQAQISFSVTAAGTIGTQLGSILDGGLFLTSAAPTLIIAGNAATGTGSSTQATIALTMGSRPDIVTIQPAP